MLNVITGDSVSIVDLFQHQTLTSFSVGLEPSGITVSSDGRFAYVTTREDDGTISVIALSDNNNLIATLHTRQPGTITRTGHRLVEVEATSCTADDPSRLEFDGSTYTRTYPNGARVHFNADGTHDYTIDRHGNTTNYTYNPDGTTATMFIRSAGSTTPQ